MREEWGCCIANLEQTLTLDPAYRDAAPRLQECRQRQIETAQQAELEGAWSKITRCKAAGDWDCVRATAKDIAVKLDPQDVGAAREFAEASLQQAQEIMNDDPAAALGLLQEALDLDFEPLPAGFTQVYNQLDGYLAGAAAHAGGEWPEAIARLTPVLSFLDARDLIYDSHVRLCQAALRSGDLANADQEAANAKQLRSDAPEADACAAGVADANYETLMAQAQRELDQGQWQAAIAICDQALLLSPDAQAPNDCIAQGNDGLYQDSFAQGQDLLNRCRLDQAIAAFNQALRSATGRVTALPRQAPARRANCRR